jgi:mRNA interferase HigB
MELLNVQTLDRAARKHREIAEWLRNWMMTAQNASWWSLVDVRQQYPSADGVPLKRIVITVFNVKGNDYRLLTIIRYASQQIVIVDVLTHAEYSKDKWKDRL